MRRFVLFALVVVVSTTRLPGAMGQTTPPVTAVGGFGNGSLNTGVGGPGGQPSGGGGQGPAVVPVSSGGGGGGGGSGGGAPSPYTVSRTYDTQGNSQVGPIPAGCLGPNGERGIRYVDTVIDTRTSEIVSTTGGCEYPGSPGPSVGGTAQPPPPPPPPTPDEMWANTPLPLPTFGINPSINGLTGMATWLWDPSAGAPVTATATVRGYTSQATATPVHYEWRMWQSGDTPNVNPNPIVGADSPGSEAHPAATYMYETHGDFTITETTTWAGTYTYTGPGVGPTTNNLGTTTRTSTRGYQVAELRPVIHQ